YKELKDRIAAFVRPVTVLIDRIQRPLQSLAKLLSKLCLIHWAQEAMNHAELQRFCTRPPQVNLVQNFSASTLVDESHEASERILRFAQSVPLLVQAPHAKHFLQLVEFRKNPINW